jgi:hypothetical protein
MSLMARLQDGATASGDGGVIDVAEYTTLGIQIKGLSNNGTISLEGTINGTDWVSFDADPVLGGAAVSSITTTGAWIANVAGFRLVRAPLSGYSGSTPISVFVFASNAVAPSNISASIEGVNVDFGTAPTSVSPDSGGVGNLGFLGGLQTRIGAAADALIAAGATGSIHAKLRRISTDIESVRALLAGTLNIAGTITANLGTIGDVATQTTLNAVLAALGPKIEPGDAIEINYLQAYADKNNPPTRDSITVYGRSLSPFSFTATASGNTVISDSGSGKIPAITAGQELRIWACRASLNTGGTAVDVSLRQGANSGAATVDVGRIYLGAVGAVASLGPPANNFWELVTANQLYINLSGGSSVFVSGWYEVVT